MKYLALLSLLFTTSAFAKIHDSFMCYTHVDTVVLFGILKENGTMRINYQRLEQNPETIDLKIKNYTRNGYSLEAIGEYNGQELISIRSKNGFGTADINLMPFRGTEDVSFTNEDVLCYFGKFEE